MSFPQSPGITVREIDLTTIVPNVSTSRGAMAGVFRWGPIGQRVLIDREDGPGGSPLTTRFGTPTTFNAETWLTLASFLAYGGAAYVVRVANTTSNNVSVSAATAYANQSGTVSNTLAHIVRTDAEYVSKDGTFDTDIQYIARWPGELGNTLRVSSCFTPNNYTQTFNLATYGASGTTFASNTGSNTATFVVSGNSISNANTAALSLSGAIAVTDVLEVGNTTTGIQYLKVANVSYTPGTDSSGNSTTGTATITVRFTDQNRLHSNVSNANGNITRYWEFFSLVGVAPGTSEYQTNQGNTAAHDEMHVVIVDDKGKFTGVSGTVLEVYKSVSRATDAQAVDGGSNYYKQVINDRSAYVWWTNDYTAAISNTATNLADATATAPLSTVFQGGADGASESNVAISVLARGYDQFLSTEDVDISLVMTGKSVGGIQSSQLANYITDNLVEVRKDCVQFISPDKGSVVDNVGSESTSILSFRNNLRSTSYAFLDSGYKYMYDRYNDVFRWIPLNGDMAGLCVRTDETNDAWWSPAGFNRGQIKNIAKLAYNPKKAERDVLYPQGVNPVVSFTGQGTILFGDRTLLAKPSAFNRINVRRLFIVLEKAISEAAKFTLFEFNDQFTRSQFKNLVNPYLRDVKGRRGITDFLVVCDETNNTGQVIDSNQFVGDIYIKPARSINFILLNFVAVNTGVAFSEVVGKFG